MSAKGKQDIYDFKDAELGGRGVSEGSVEDTNSVQDKTSGRFTKWRASVSNMVAKFWTPLLKQLRKLVSVPFLVMLLLSFSLWYAIKLSYNYQAEVPFEVVVDGHEFRVKCVVEGQGARLVARKLSRNSEIVLDWGDLDVSTSAANPGAVVISPYSLQNAISAQSTDIKVLSVGPIPEIEL